MPIKQLKVLIPFAKTSTGNLDGGVTPDMAFHGPHIRNSSCNNINWNSNAVLLLARLMLESVVKAGAVSQKSPIVQNPSLTLPKFSGIGTTGAPGAGTPVKIIISSIYHV